MIIGNKNITNFLEKSFEGGALTHAYIFSGPHGIGKRTVAEWFAKKNLVTENLSTHPDFIELKAENGVIKKEDIDKIIERARLSSFSGGKKFILVDDAHNMNSSSANAFLKTLEEPPKNTFIVLLTSELSKILPTIISRSSLLHFRPVKNSLIAEYLDKNYKLQNSMLLAKASYGRPGIAIRMATGQLDYKQESLEEFCNLFLGDEKNRITFARNILSEKSKNKEVLLSKIDSWLEVVRSFILIKYNLNDKAIHLPDPVFQEKPIQYFTALAKRLINMKSLLKNNINPSLMLENLII